MENHNNDKTDSNSSITNQTILFTSLSGYLAFSRNNDKKLNIYQYQNSIKKYALKNSPNQYSNNQTKKEYYIQLQENQKKLKFIQTIISHKKILAIGYIVEISDWVKQKLDIDYTGFDEGDIMAYKRDIEYGNELRIIYGKII